MSVFRGAVAQIETTSCGRWDYPSEPDPADFYDDRDADRPDVEPFICKADGDEVWPDDEDSILSHNEVCADPDKFAEHFGDTLRDAGVID